MSAAKARTLAKLTPTKPSGTPVSFMFNPEKVTVSHQLKLQEMPGQKAPDAKGAGSGGANTPVLPFEEVTRQLGITTIGLSSLQFFGPDTITTCDRLLSWSYAVKDAEQENKMVPIELVFKWGAGLEYKVYMEQVKVAYTKFASNGKPVRATVDLTMHRFDTAAPGQNPTSGGLPGRRSHVLDGSECLPSVAMAAYGRPSAWRDVARANGIDDPLRVRPGRTLYLPNPQELRRDEEGRT